MKKIWQFSFALGLGIVLVSLSFFFETCSSQPKSIREQNIHKLNQWQIHSSQDIAVSGKKISLPDYKTENWYAASVPTTVLAALVADSVYTNLFVGKNLDKVDTTQFDSSWWYRTSFQLPKDALKKRILLEFDGINYRANVWMNGHQIASKDSLYGAFNRFSLDATSRAQSGENILAVEVFPPVPGDFTMGFVDWNPEPPDKNMGLWRPVRVHVVNPVEIRSPFVETDLNVTTLKDADLTVNTILVNRSDSTLDGVLSVNIGNVSLTKNVTLTPFENKTVTLTPKEYPALHFVNPRIWWPYQYGNPELYTLKVQFETDRGISDQTQTKFGIRKVSDYINKAGFRGYRINGKDILIKGGGWTDNMMLSNTPENLRDQIRYVKQMNLNAIRLEGFWGEGQTLYNLCDEEGILIMAGWSCQWEWGHLVGKTCDVFGGVTTPQDIKLVSGYWRNQILWLRGHPSIFTWLYGSDKIPRPTAENAYLHILDNIDPTRPAVGSAAEHTSEVTGPTAMKMRGPYDFTPPNYWYLDTKHGGAFGFNTETGPGGQVPPLVSLKRMFPADKLWPINDVWDYHTNRGKFHSIETYQKPLDKRYGPSASVSEFAQKAQMMNYELIRAMYEAFDANKYKSTGIIQWMLNSAWPNLYWQLYDYYLTPTGAFYGAQEAGKPFHILYRYGLGDIWTTNATLQDTSNLTATIRVFDINSKEIFSKQLPANLPANHSQSLFSLPKRLPVSSVYFLDLRLTDQSGKEVDHNFYWLSTQKDVPDFPKTKWWVTPTKEYADYTQLSELPEAQVSSTMSIEKQGDTQVATVHLTNNSDGIAFFVQSAIVDQKTHQWILPVFWSANYVSLLPHESRQLTAEFSVDASAGKSLELHVSGPNIQ